VLLINLFNSVEPKINRQYNRLRIRPVSHKKFTFRNKVLCFASVTSNSLFSQPNKTSLLLFEILILFLNCNYNLLLFACLFTVCFYAKWYFICIYIYFTHFLANNINNSFNLITDATLFVHFFFGFGFVVSLTRVGSNIYLFYGLISACLRFTHLRRDSSSLKLSYKIQSFNLYPKIQNKAHNAVFNLAVITCRTNYNITIIYWNAGGKQDNNVKSVVQYTTLPSKCILISMRIVYFVMSNKHSPLHCICI